MELNINLHNFFFSFLLLVTVDSQVQWLKLVRHVSRNEYNGNIMFFVKIQDNLS